jgi:hypothetical protein
MKKSQSWLTDKMARKPLSLFPTSNSYQNILEHLSDLYRIEVSNNTIN